MTTTLELRFPFGRYHGTPWGRNVNEGAVDWPPAPWRLLRALVAVWKERAPELPEADIVTLLAALSDPPRYVAPEAEGTHTRHYMPAIDHLQGVNASTSKVVDAFTAFERGSALYAEWDVTLPDGPRHALEVLAQRLAYLGRSESVCVGRLLPAGSPRPEAGWLRPALEDPGRSAQGPSAYERVLAPSTPLDVASLFQRTSEVREGGSLLPRGTRWAWYPSVVRTSADPRREGKPRTIATPAARRPVALRWAYWAPALPPLTLAVALADALHRAAAARFAERRIASEGRALLGRDAEGGVLEGHGHAHWLAFPLKSGERRVDCIAVYAKDGFDAEETAALAGLSELRSVIGTHLLRGRLALEAVGMAAAAIPELVGPSRVWESVTPYAPPRHPRPRQSFTEHLERHVRRDLARLGLPEPGRVSTLDSPGSWLDFRRYRLQERFEDARPARGIVLEFTEPSRDPSSWGRSVTSVSGSLGLRWRGEDAVAPPEDSPGALPRLVPVSMLRAYAYCPRLFYLEWVSAEFEGSVDTAAGEWVHRVVDEESGAVPLPDEGDLVVAHSVLVSSETLGMIARVDLVEGEGGSVVPVEYKKGSGPGSPGEAWEADHLQLCAQMMLLRERGYHCDHGFVYYAAARRRVEVSLDEEAIQKVYRVLAELRSLATRGVAPQPLVDSPKCPRCSLVGICLPDEVNLLSQRSARSPRRLVPRDQDAAPLYVTEQGSWVRKVGGRLEVTVGREVRASFRDIDVSQLCLFGSVQVSTQALRELLGREVPVCWFSHGGWFWGIATGMPARNVALRLAQYGTASSARALEACRGFVYGKIRNGRTLLRRNARQDVSEALVRLREASLAALAAKDMESLLGIEGAAARTYFGEFAKALAPPKELGPLATFDFTGRNRRPPRDAVNCLLSYVYGLLVKDLTVTCLAVGTDPYFGLYHHPRYGRPALALDLAEEFRPLVGDSVVLQVVNNGEVGRTDFVTRAGAVSLTPAGRRKVLFAYERRLRHLVQHPLFGYRTTYRRALEVQARLLAAWLLGEVPDYVAFTTR